MKQENRVASIRAYFALAVVVPHAIWPAVSLADVPTYTVFELQARSNFGVNPSGSYNLPPNVFFNSVTPALNNAGQVAFKVSPVGKAQGVWFGAGGSGSIAYVSPNDAFISDVSLNNQGYVVFPQTFSSQNGIYFYDGATNSSGFKVSHPIGTSSWGSPQVNDSGHIAHRPTFSGSGNAWWSYDGQSTLTGAFHAVETSVDPISPYSFLFTPSFNNSRAIAGKVQVSGGNEIRIIDVSGNSTLIARSNSLNPKSIFSNFDNSVSLTDTGWVAFNATLVGGGRGVYLSNGSTTIEIATTFNAAINTIEFFPPAANNNGLVVFRARDNNNYYAIFVGDGTDLRRVIGQWDTIPTDQGPAWIAQHDTSVTFGGAVAINDHGDIAFNAALTPEGNNQIEWGSGIFIAYADANTPTLGDLNNDGVVDVLDLLILLGSWGACPKSGPCPADLNNSGVVDVQDLLILLSNWG